MLYHQIFLYAHFHIGPTQVFIPNNRPRYYGVEVRTRKRNNFRGDSFQRLLFPKQVASDKESELLINTHTQYFGKKIIALPPISEFLDNDARMESLRVPKKVLSSSASWCFDIVTPSYNRSSCFTQSYGHFFRGNDSVLYVETQ